MKQRDLDLLLTALKQERANLTIAIDAFERMAGTEADPVEAPAPRPRRKRKQSPEHIAKRMAAMQATRKRRSRVNGSGKAATA